MHRTPRRAACVGLLLAALFLGLAARAGQERATPQWKELAAVLQPYVEKGTLAGPVVLVADRDKYPRPGSGRLRGHCRQDAHGHRRPVLDRLGVEADHTPRRSCCSWTPARSNWMTRSRNTCRSSRGQLVEVKEDGKKVLKKPGHAITVREVLSHTSGLPFKQPRQSGRRSTCCR